MIWQKATFRENRLINQPSVTPFGNLWRLSLVLLLRTSMVIWLVTFWETQALLSLRQQPGQTRGWSRPRTIGSSGVGARHKILLYCGVGRLQILIPRAFMIR